jgi:hypothetical protein
MLTTSQSCLVLCLLALDEGASPVSGRELETVLERRRAQMVFIRAKCAALGEQDEISDDDWGVANAWLQELLPNGYHLSMRPLLADVIAEMSRPTIRRLLEAVSAVVQWDGNISEGEALLFDDLARVAKLNDRSSRDDLDRIGRRLARVS